jgi:hypothetical protein
MNERREGRLDAMMDWLAVFKIRDFMMASFVVDK